MDGGTKIVVMARVDDDAKSVEVRGVNYVSDGGLDNVLFRLSRRDGAKPSVSVGSLADDAYQINMRVASALGYMSAAGWFVGEMEPIYFA